MCVCMSWGRDTHGELAGPMMVDTHSKRLSPLGPAEQLHGGSKLISASSFWILQRHEQHEHEHEYKQHKPKHTPRRCPNNFTRSRLPSEHAPWLKCSGK